MKMETIQFLYSIYSDLYVRVYIKYIVVIYTTCYTLCIGISYKFSYKDILYGGNPGVLMTESNYGPSFAQ